MSLAGNFGRSGGGMSPGGMRIIRHAKGNQITPEEAAEKARVAGRLNLLQQELPALAYSQPSILTDLAAAATDDDDMMTAAIGAMTAVDMENTITQLREMPKEQQIGLAAGMNPVKREALVTNGWQIPNPDDEGGGGFWGGLKKTVSLANPVLPGAGFIFDKVKREKGVDLNPMSPVGAGIAKVASEAAKLPVISQGLSAMDWAAEEASHPTRVGPMAGSGQRLLGQTGETQEQLLARTGIATPGANMESNVEMTGFGPGMVAGSIGALFGVGNAPKIPEVFKFATNPGDIWKAVQVWDTIGHEGDDDILPEVQYAVFEQLNTEFSGQGKDMLRWAKAMSSGSTIEDLAEQEGLEGEQAAAFVQRVGLLSTTSGFKKAVSQLETGRISAGRTAARHLFEDPLLDTSEGAARYVSGSVDLVYSVVADPTIVAGKASKAVKLARWGFKGAEGAETLDRWQKMTRVLANASDEGADTAKLAEEMERIGGGGRFLTGATAEAEAVARPAMAVQEAFRTGDFGTLVKQYPAMMRSITDMQTYDDLLKANDLPGMAEDAGQVFEFYKHAAFERSVLGSATDVGKLSFNTKLFGHDGAGHLIVPHMTRTQRGRMLARTSIRDWVVNADEIPGEVLADVKASADEAAEDLARQQGDDAPTVAEDMEVNPVTLSYQRKTPNGLKQHLSSLYRTVATPTTRRGFVPLDSAAAPEEFRAFNESLGIIEGSSEILRKERFNRFVNGNIAERHTLINEMIVRMADSTGLSATDEGQQLVRKYVEHNNHVFGFHDALQRAKGGSEDARRLVTRQAIMEPQLAEGLSVPSMRDMVIATRNVNTMRLVAGTTRKSHLESAMSRIWKPGVIMRFGFPLRAGFDEAIQYMGRVSLKKYIEKTTVEKWAGIANPTVGPEGAIKPIRTFTRSLSTVAGGTDDAIRRKVQQRLAQDVDYIAALPARRAEIESAAMAEAGLKDLRFVPKVFRAADDFAWMAATRGSKKFHDLAVSKYVSRQKLAEFYLEHATDMAKTVRNRRLLQGHTAAQQDMAEVLGNSYSGLRPGERGEVSGDLMMGFSDTSPSGFQALPVVTDKGEYKWVGHGDPTQFYLNLSNWMENMGKSPGARAAMQELQHHVPQTVLDEVAEAFGVDGIDGLRRIRDVAASNDAVRAQLAHAVNTEASAATLRASLEANGLDATDYNNLLDKWDDLSPDTKFFVADNNLQSWRLDSDLALIQDRAANATYNALRRLDGTSNLRSLIRAQTVDGRIVAAPLKRGHARIYAPVIDRRNAEDLIRLFTDEHMAQAFAERLAEHLKARNLFGEMKAVWDGAPPSDAGWDHVAWMAGLKGQVATGGSSYVTAMMSGSSNYAVAEAMRDALADIIPDTMLRPTIGFFDTPQSMIDKGKGVRRLSESTVAVTPAHAAKFQPIDPDNVVRQVHVQHADGRREWLGEQELDGLAGRRGRVDKVAVDRSFSRNTGLTATDRRTKQVRYNPALIDQDYRDGMRFLRGDAGTFARTKADWAWTDPEMQAAADRLAGILDGMGLGENAGMDFGELVSAYRQPNRQGPIPLQGKMEDAELRHYFKHLSLDDDRSVWDLFDSVAKQGKSQGRRTVEEWSDEAVAVQSGLVRQALAELDVDVDSLNLSRSQYKRLLIEREKAHAVLDPAGFGRPKTATKAALEREKDALAIAFQRADIDGVDLSDRLEVAMSKEKDDYRILGEIWGTGVTEDAAVRRTAQDILGEVNGVFIGEQSKQVLHGILSPLLRGEHSMDNLWRRVSLDELPTKAFGPTRVVAEQSRWDQFLNRTFQGAVEPIIGAISRMPMFNDAFDKSMDVVRPVFDNHVHKGLDAEARTILDRAGVTVDDMEDVNSLIYGKLKDDPDLGDGLDDPITAYARNIKKGDYDEARAQLSAVVGRPVALTDDELEVLSRWHLNQSAAWDAYVGKAAQRATEMVTPYIDDHRLRSALQEYVGPVILPFYYAEEQFLKRFARGLYETPHMLRKGQLTMNGLRNIGIVREDAYGNEIVVIPGSEILMGVMADVATMVTGNEAFQVLDQPLAMRTEFVLPGWNTEQSRWGWGPIIGLSVDKMTQRYPEMEWRKEPPNRAWWQYVVPGPAAGAYKAFIQESDPAAVASAQMAAISYLESTGNGLPEDATASQREKYLEDIRQVTRSVGILRYITGQLSFTTAAPVDQEAMMRKEFTDLLARGLDYGDAVDAFLEENGPEAMVYTVFGTENEAGAPLPNTEDAWRYMLEHEDFVADNPTAAAWLLPQAEERNEFDRRAYNEQLAVGLRTKRSPDELLDEIYIKQASGTYFDKKDEHDSRRRVMLAERDAAKGRQREAIQAEINALDDEWDSWKGGYLAQHPVFAESFSPEAHERRLKTIEDLEWAIAAGMGGEQGDVIEPLVSDFRAFTRKYASYSNQSSKAAEEIKAAMLTDYFDDQWLYVQRNPKAAVFWNSVIRPELPDQADTLATEKLTEGA